MQDKRSWETVAAQNYSRYSNKRTGAIHIHIHTASSCFQSQPVQGHGLFHVIDVCCNRLHW